MSPQASSWMASFSAAGLLGVMADRPWFAAAAFFIAAVAALLGIDWAGEDADG